MGVPDCVRSAIGIGGSRSQIALGDRLVVTLVMPTIKFTATKFFVGFLSPFLPPFLPFLLSVTSLDSVCRKYFKMSRVYVGNLDPRVSERELEDEFRVFGVIRR